MADDHTQTVEAARSLKALEAIERNPRISQRELARSMGVALGVANVCVRTLARKGLVKVRGDSNRSISYHITKEGRVQKARLAMEWTGNTIDYYVQARATLARLLGELAARGIRSVIVFGADEAAELVVLLAPHAGIEIRAVVAAGGRRIGDTILDQPVREPRDVAPGADAVIATSAPEPSQLAILEGSFPGTPVVLLNGQTLEGTLQ